MIQDLLTTAGSATLTCEFHPATTAQVKGAVVIVYGSDGMTNHLSGPWASMIRGYAENLAALQLHVLIPD